MPGRYGRIESDQTFTLKKWFYSNDEKDVERLTPTEICEAANVSIHTFYNFAARARIRYRHFDGGIREACSLGLAYYPNERCLVRAALEYVIIKKYGDIVKRTQYPFEKFMAGEGGL